MNIKVFILIFIGWTFLLSFLFIFVVIQYTKPKVPLGHPFPREGHEYVYQTSNATEPNLRIYMEQWTDGEWKLLSVLFIDSNGRNIFVLCSPPWDPKQLYIKEITDIQSGTGVVLTAKESTIKRL
ncbi:MAG TPA: hypothetical protein PLX18_11305 [Anaerohalosphaeraceae bacterium]|jgi:hypothetical protein|nr:hypothetical protein [Anaerohalosphaeraceae bacterium]HQI08428.1 hypothetical protein [Anaerohalosphaeraceae bacterium]HQJ68820.1 hypothetical protein [Anaerohalosphaeraceae bacterium]